jgi:thymidylate synthase
MHQLEKEYLSLLRDVYTSGDDVMDRTGVGTRKLFGRQIRGDLQEGFPLLTTKQVFWKPVAGELLWFLSSSRDNKDLALTTYGDKTRSTIWSGNANGAGLPGSENAWLKNKYRLGEDDLGRVYGLQWRQWRSHEIESFDHHISSGESGNTYLGAKVKVRNIDQVANIIQTIKTNPQDRRMILTAYNVGELNQMALPPCHMFANFNVSAKGRLNCLVYIRSQDLFLGCPFNIASYALLTHMIAQVTNLEPGELILTIGDAHIYKNHLPQVEEQLSRTILEPPTLSINKSIKNIDDFKMSDFEIIGYKHHPVIKATMAV